MALNDHRHFLSDKKIVVSGGGIAGPTFAFALLSGWSSSPTTPSLPPPRIHIYERDDEDPLRHREAWSLSLSAINGKGGLLVLKELGLLESVFQKADSGTDPATAGSFKLWSKQWEERAVFPQKPTNGMPVSSIRIRRRELRAILHSKCREKGVVFHWGKQCLSARRTSSGRLAVAVRDLARVADQSHRQDEVTTEPEREEDFDLLIATDGASSKLRAFLYPEEKLVYTGATLRGGLSRFPGSGPPAPLDKDWGFQSSGTGITCFYSPIDKDSVIWAVGNMEKEMAIPDTSGEKAAQLVIDKAKTLGAAFGDRFTTVAEHIDLGAVMCINAKDKLPFRHDARKLQDLPVVFLGDANHALSPFAGVGANLALLDGRDLADKLLRGEGLIDAVEAYDDVAVPRAESTVVESRKKLAMGHAPWWKVWLYWLTMAMVKVIRMVLGRQ